MPLPAFRIAVVAAAAAVALGIAIVVSRRAGTVPTPSEKKKKKQAPGEAQTSLQKASIRSFPDCPRSVVFPPTLPAAPVPICEGATPNLLSPQISSSVQSQEPPPFSIPPSEEGGVSFCGAGDCSGEYGTLGISTVYGYRLPELPAVDLEHNPAMVELHLCHASTVELAHAVTSTRRAMKNLAGESRYTAEESLKLSEIKLKLAAELRRAGKEIFNQWAATLRESGILRAAGRGRKRKRGRHQCWKGCRLHDAV